MTIRNTIALAFEPGEPAQCSQSGHEAVFTAARDYKPGNALETFSKRFAWQGEVDVARSGNRIFIVSGAEENAVIDPLRLNKLELPPDICSDKCEHQPAINSIIDHDSFRKHWSISSAAADHSMYTRHAGNRRVAWVAATDVRATRCFEPSRIVGFKKKVVVSFRILSERRIIVKRTERERGTTTPAAHHLRRQQFFICDTG